MKAYFEYNIPDGYVVKEGDTITVQVPEQLLIANNVKFDLKDASGNLIGNATVDKNTGEISIVFTDYYETHTNNRHGSFTVTTSWNKDIVLEDTDVNVNGKIIHVTSSSTPDEDEKLYKWGWVDKENPELINWVVRVNYSREAISNAVYKDYVGKNQLLVSDSIVAEIGTFNGNDFISESTLEKVQSMKQLMVQVLQLIMET